MSQKNTIKINGRHYDAVTGHPLDKAGPTVVKPTRAVQPKAKLRPIHDVVRRPGVTTTAHTPELSQTLMRQAVRKPAAAKRQLKVQARSDAPAEAPLAELVIGTSVKRIDPKRLHKAKHVKQSHLISHFSASGGQPAGAVYQLPVVQPQASVPPVTTKPAPIHQVPAKHRTSSDVLEHALRTATSHHQPKATKRRRHRGLAAASVTAALLLVGIVGFTQLPDWRMQVAAAKAGFDASLPSYRPAGYSLASLNAGPGAVSSLFHSNSDSRSYSLTQKPSTWSSDDLVDSFVKDRGAYQTAQSGGRTIYLYDQGSATWVDGGIWYIVQSHGALSDRQLTELASSL